MVSVKNAGVSVRKSGFAALVWSIFLVASAQAQGLGRSDAIVAAWQGWVAANGVSRSSLAIAVDGKIVRSEAKGRAANSRVPLASLSKAITAACVRQLVSAGKLSLDTRLGQVFGADLSGLGLSAPKAAELRIRQFLSQSAGLAPDGTQAAMPGWLNTRTVRHETVSRNALGRARQKSRPGRYFYNNENYAVLGAVVTRVTGQRYADYCAARVLRPLGIRSARMSRTFGALGAWGGWEMTVADYLRFVLAEFGPTSPVGKDPRRWAKVNIGGGAFYGMGTLFRKSAKGYNFWHVGAHCYGGGNDAGSFFASWADGMAVVVAYDICASNSQATSLDNALYRAAH